LLDIICRHEDMHYELVCLSSTSPHQECDNISWLYQMWKQS